MNIHLLSDLHLEFSNFRPASVTADLVILAGDIATGHQGLKWALSNFKGLPVVYIPGNHEFYYTSVEAWYAEADAMLAGQSRVQLGHKRVTFFQAPSKPRVRVLATTLWTDFALYGPDSREYSGHCGQNGLSDFEVIQYQGRPLTWRDTVAFHKDELAWLKGEVAAGMAAGDQIVVATHHGSTSACNHPKYPNSNLTPAFTSRLESWIMDSRIKAWFFGHTHHNLDLMVGDTRLLSNQRGYARPDVRPECPDFDPSLLISI